MCPRSALRKALQPFFPEVSRIHLSDYKVRIPRWPQRHWCGPPVVLIDSQSEHDSWSTVGASSNIIEASLQALIDSIEYGLKLESASARSEREANVT